MGSVNATGSTVWIVCSIRITERRTESDGASECGTEAKQTKHVTLQVEQQISGDHFEGRHQKTKRLAIHNRLAN